MSEHWAHKLEADSVVYDAAQGTISVKVNDREWREVGLSDGGSRTNVYMENYYKEDHVIHEADGTLAKIQGFPVGHVITLEARALLKRGRDFWHSTGTANELSDEEVNSILHIYGVTL